MKGLGIISIENAKRMKELEFSQKSIFFYINTVRDVFVLDHNGRFDLHDCSFSIRTYPAYTTAEMGEALAPYGIHYSKDGNQWCALNGGDLASGHATFADTLADVMAETLIYLAENGLITPQKCL